MSTDPASRAFPAGLSGQAFASLAQAIQGLRNRDAIVAMLGCTFAGVILAGLLMAAAGALGFLATLLAFVVWVVAIGTGINAAGLLQMDRARGISPRSLGDALIQGALCIPKLIVLALALLAVEIAVFIAIALLLVICKIPLLGPILFVVVFPVSVVVAGVTVAALFICGVLSLPAIWQGAGITRALGQTLAIVKSRLVEAVLLLFVLGVLCFLVGMIVFGILGAGLVPTLGMAAAILHFGGLGMDSMMAMPQGGGGGHAIAGAIGGALLWAAAASLVGQVYLLGLSLVYLRVTDGLDLTAAEASLRAAFDDAKRRTAELGEKARQATQRETTPAAPGAPVPPPTTTMSPMSPMSPSTTPASTMPVEPFAPFEPAAMAASAAAAAMAPPPVAPPAAALSGTPVDFPIGEPTTIAAPRSIDVPGSDVDLPLDVAAPAANAAPARSASTPTSMSTPTPTPPAGSLPAPTPLPAPTACPQCLSAISPDDIFCGVCGYRLK